MTFEIQNTYNLASLLLISLFETTLMYLRYCHNLLHFKQALHKDALFILPRESGLTADVVAQDTRRDTNLRGLTQVIRGYLNHFDPAFRNAALLLDKNIRLYGPQVYNQNYQSESNSITNMTADWQETTALAEALELLGLREWGNELRTSNDAFIELYVLRTQEFGARTKDKLRDKRLEIDAAYLQLVTVLNARATLDEGNTYITVINELNALIDQTQATLHNRQARGDNDEEDDTPSEE